MTLGRKIALNAAALGSARIVNAVMGVVAVGVTTRYLGVSGYGALVTALAFVSLVAAFNDIGVGTIVAREIAKRPDETDRLIRAGFTLVLALSGVAAVIGLGLMLVVYPGADRELERQGIVLLLLVPLPIAAPAAAAGAYFISQQRAYVGGLGAFAGSVLNLVLLLAVVTFDWGFIGVGIAYAAQAIGFGIVMIVASRGLRLRPAWDMALCAELLRWALPLGSGLLLASLYYRIDVLLLSLLGTDRDVGLYGLSYRFVETLLILPSYVTITLLPEFARLEEQRDRLAQIVRKAFDVMVVGVLPILVVFIVFATEITEVLGGASFTGAAPVLQILMVGIGAGFLSALFVQPIVALGRQKWILYQVSVMLTTNVVLNIALIPPFGATGAAVAFTASELVSLVVTGALYARLAPLPRPQRVPRVLGAGVAMCAVALLKFTPVGDVLGQVGSVLALGSLGVGAYVAGLYLFRGMPPEINDSLVKPILARVGGWIPARDRH